MKNIWKRFAMMVCVFCLVVCIIPLSANARVYNLMQNGGSGLVANKTILYGGVDSIKNDWNSGEWTCYLKFGNGSLITLKESMGAYPVPAGKWLVVATSYDSRPAAICTLHDVCVDNNPKDCKCDLCGDDMHVNANNDCVCDKCGMPIAGVPESAHTLVDVENGTLQAATCVATGRMQTYCTTCKQNFERTIPIAPDAHLNEDNNCICDRAGCGKVITDNHVDVEPENCVCDFCEKDLHNWSEWQDTAAATCVAGKLQTRVCANNSEHKETKNVGDPDDNAHKWGDWEDAAAANCTHGKEQTRICELNSAHVDTQYVGEVDPDAHAWGEWQDTADATCIKGAEQTRICAHNAEHVDTQYVGEPNSEAHVWAGWQHAADATCKTGAKETNVCTLDNTHTDERFVGEADPEAHVWAGWQDADAATCTTKTRQTNVCKLDATHTAEQFVGEIDPDGHDWGDWIVEKAPTCLDAGAKHRICKNDESHVDKATPAALGHKWDKGTVIKAPTYWSKGTILYTCQNDKNHTHTAELPMLIAVASSGLDNVPKTGDVMIPAVLVLAVFGAGAYLLTRKRTA